MCAVAGCTYKVLLLAFREYLDGWLELEGLVLVLKRDHSLRPPHGFKRMLLARATVKPKESDKIGV